MRNKWNEQEMIQTRRSVSSSPSSESESNDAQEANKHHQQQMSQHIPANMRAPQLSDALRMTEMLLNESVSATPAIGQSFVGRPHTSNDGMRDDDKIPKIRTTQDISKMLLDNMQIPYGMQSQQSMPIKNLHPQQTHPAGQSFNYPNDNNQFSAMGSMYPPTNLNAQLPFPTPGPPTFGAPYSSASNSQQPPNHDPLSANTSLNHPSKPCAAAFTLSTSNLGKFFRCCSH